jgi:putative transposase
LVAAKLTKEDAVAPKQQDTTVEALSQSNFQSLLQEQVRMAVRLTLVKILVEKVSALIGVLPYQRTPERRDYRNGHYTRDLETTVDLLEDLSVPRTRNGHQTQPFDSYKRRRPIPHDQRLVQAVKVPRQS